jgi:hypothetical protein
MQTRWGNWLPVLAVLILLALVAGFCILSVTGGRMMSGGGWPGPFHMPNMFPSIFSIIMVGMMLAIMAAPVLLVALVIIGVLLLLRHNAPTTGQAAPPPSQRSCPSCSRPVEAGWRNCPHCGKDLYL